MKKRGISAVIATVLTVLITVASVTILWAGVQPILDKAAFVESPDVKFDIDKSGSFTLYDPDTGYLSVRVTRGSDNDDPPVVALNFIISIEGNSIIRKTYNVAPPNHGLVYYFLVGFDVNIDSVKVVPVYLVNGEEVDGQAFDIEAKIPINPGEYLSEIGNLPVEQNPDDPVTFGLIFYYSFDEDYVEYDDPSDTATLIDQSGAGHVGTYNNMDGTDKIVPGIRGNGIEFDGTDDYISFAHDTGYDEEIRIEEKTISFWARPIIDKENSYIFGSYRNYYINIFDHPFASPPQFVVGYDNAGGNQDYIEDQVSIDWRFYTVVFEENGANDKITLYTDDGTNLLAPIEETLGNFDVVDQDYLFFLGTGAQIGGLLPNLFNTYHGYLDEFRIYNRTLSDDEISSLYNLGK